MTRNMTGKPKIFFLGIPTHTHPNHSNTKIHLFINSNTMKKFLVTSFIILTLNSCEDDLDPRIGCQERMQELYEIYQTRLSIYRSGIIGYDRVERAFQDYLRQKEICESKF